MKIQKNFILTTLFILLSAYTSWSQYQPGKIGNGIMQDVSPVSPLASSLGKYGEWPVSYYTGTTDISIPIFEIQRNGFKLPVGLSYHTGGIKVDELSSGTGTGWTLNAGGVITRTIVGIGDEEYNGYLSRNLRNESTKFNYNLQNIEDYLFLRQVDNRQMDTEPDLFFFNFCGHSGKFYFDKTGKFQAIPVNSLKLITSPMTNPQIEHWEIADEHGNIFYFGSEGQGIENVTINSLFKNSTKQIEVKPPSAWYLTKIVLINNGGTISLNYVAKDEKYVEAPLYSYKQITFNQDPLSNISDSGEKLGINKILRNGEANDGTYSPTRVFVGGLSQLNSIKWDEGEINFVSNLTRSDITGKNLSQVIILDKKLNKVKEAKLLYSLQGGRYFLDSLVEYGKTQRSGRYAFTYESPGNLAPRFSNSQDHWGYFNGAANTHLIPPRPDLNDPILNANREPDENRAKLGSLKSIKYPTGGETEFDFESNRYNGEVPGGGNPTQPIIGATAIVGAYDPQPPGQEQRTTVFKIPFAQNLVTIDLTFKNYGRPASKKASVLPLAKLERLVNGVYQVVQSWDAWDMFPKNPILNSNGLYDYEITTAAFNLELGDYRLTADLLPEQMGLGDPLPIMPSVRATLKYQSYGSSGAGTSSTYPLAGGLRLKQSINKVNGVVINRTKYSYLPGRLLIYPKYVHYYGEDVFPFFSCHSTPNGCGSLCRTSFVDYTEVLSTSQSVLGFTQGSPVGYLSVQESNVSEEGVENGRTDYSYSFEADVVNELQFDSYWTDVAIANTTIPLNNNEYKRGLLLGKDTYKRITDGTMVKIKSTSNSYIFNNVNRYNTLRSLRVIRMRKVNYPCGNEIYVGGVVPPSGFSPDFAYSYYDIFTGWVQHKSIIEANYDASGLNPIVAKTNYEYLNPSHLQVTNSVIELSDSSSSSTQFLYPEDMINKGRDLSGTYQAMLNKNIISPIIEEKSTHNNSIKLQLNNFIQPFSDIFVIGTVEQMNSKSLLNETRLRYHNYNDSGKPLSMSIEKGPKTCYIWSYNKQHIIAEIKNANYATVEAALGGAVAVNNFANAIPADKAAVDAFLSPIRTSLSLKDAHVTSYSYKSLVGLSSTTDAKGQSTYFEYDDGNRLKFVKDHNQNVIKAVDYHYQP
jgi:hypothetical protein